MKRIEILNVKGMTCGGCESRITRTINELPGVEKVLASYTKAKVEVEVDESKTSLAEVVRVIEGLGYQVSTCPADDKKLNLTNLLGFAVMVGVLYLALKNTALLNTVPQIENAMNIGLLFLVGIITSVHCVAMCGGIVITQTTTKITDSPPKHNLQDRIWPSFSYNLGRIISYTIIGGLAGLLGSAVTFSGTARGVVAIIAGLLVIVVGLNMVGLFSWTRFFSMRLPETMQTRLFKLQSTRQPFLVGIANGFMPCGPLQAMQLYALGTASFISGAKAMLIFGLGTFPLLFAFGFLNTYLSQKLAGKILRVGAVVVTAMGLTMVSRGLALSGLSLPSSALADTGKDAPVAEMKSGSQVIKTVVDQYGYSPSVVYLKKGVPVRWEINAKSLNGCNNPITIPELGIEKELKPGINVIEFTPKKEGPLVYTCWMGMISAEFQVVGDLDKAKDLPLDTTVRPSAGGGGCCAR